MVAKTSKQLEEMRPTDQSESAWLRELCLQVALLREKEPAPAPEPPKIQPKARR